MARRFLVAYSVGSAVVGAMLLIVSALGLAVPLRATDVDGYLDFSGAPTLPFNTAMARLEEITRADLPAEELVAAATRLFHEGIAHVSPADVRANGVEHYRMRVPATENWILFALSYLKPDTYRDYEFCSHRRALERGTGRCGQQSLALVSYLAAQGIETGFVALGGHALATAKVNDSDWYLLDADYGGVIPFDISVAERNPDSVLPYYWSPAAHVNHIHELYAPDNEVKYGGPTARYARACPIEQAAYILKWLVPLALLVPFGILALRRG